MPYKKGHVSYNKGKSPSIETRKRISNAKKGNPSPKKGVPMSEEQKTKLSESQKKRHVNGFVVWNKGLKGLHLSPKTEFKKGQVSSNKGKKMIDETKKKLSLSKLGKPSPFKGMKRPAKDCIAISISKKGKCIGNKNSNWRGGASFIPYCHKFNNQLKEAVRNRDNRTCQLCNTKENGKKHSVHHIHYDKQNCYPDLIVLCTSCNTKVNFNRDFYEELFTFILWVRSMLQWKPQF